MSELHVAAFGDYVDENFERKPCQYIYFSDRQPKIICSQVWQQSEQREQVWDRVACE